MGADARHLLSANGAAVVVLLLSAVVFTSDHQAYERAVEERHAASVLAGSHAAGVESYISLLEGRVRAWLTRTGHERYAGLSRDELYKSPWTAQAGSGSAVAVASGAKRDAKRSRKGEITWLGPGRRAHTESPEPVLELTDEALQHWEKTIQERRRRSIVHVMPASGVVTQIPGREEPPDENVALQDYSQKHPLLVYSKDKFATTPVSKMTEEYKPPASGKVRGWGECHVCMQDHACVRVCACVLPGAHSGLPLAACLCVPHFRTPSHALPVVYIYIYIYI